MSSIQYLIGKTLGKYEVLEHLGHGGMSEVYKGQQSQLNRMVAIKVLHPFLADEEGFVVRFQREARIVATMRHPNIVQVFDFDYNDELALYYMVMEYIDGPTLKDLLEDDRYSPEETARIGAAVADALDYAHQRNMIHRDIKPANIMFLEEDQPVLTDFGIAKMLTLSGLTASGAMVGTPAYMAPEIGLGQAGTPASDIYSLSVVLYQAATGALPFTAETPMGMVMQHINKTPMSPSVYVPELPAALEAVIMRGLEKTPQDRYATAGEMARALRLAHSPADEVEGQPNPLEILVPLPDATEQRGEGDPPATDVAVAAPPATTGATPEDLPARADGNGHHVGDEPDTTASPVGPETAARTDSDSDLQPQRRRRTLFRLAFLLVATLVLTGGLWYGTQGTLPPALQNILTASSAAAPQTIREVPLPPTPTSPVGTETPTPTPQPEITPDGAASQAVAGSATQATPAPCTQRVRVEGVQIKPDATTAPGATLIAYVSLRNSGSCPWPQTTTLVRLDDNAPTAPDRFPAGAVVEGETIQFVIPMTAPEALGTYDVTWELRVGEEPLGRGGSGLVAYQLTVDDVDTPEPAPLEEIELVDPTPAPLAVAPPALRSWELLPAQSLWRGTVAITVTGGTGTYQIYHERISAETAVRDGTLTFEAPRCRPYPLDLWILSGQEALNWQAVVSPPTSGACP